jgi:hypothetical protein
VPLPPATLLLLVILLIVVIVTLLHHERVRTGKITIQLRPLAGLDVLRRALAHGAETGRAIHVSPGPGTIGGRGTTGETIAGLLAAERIATEAALNGAGILCSSGDAVAHLSLRGTLRQAYQRAGLGQDYRPGNVELLSQQDSMAYASGVTTLYGRQPLEASQMFGAFDQELLLAGEVGEQLHVPQIVAATSTTAQPLALLSAQGTLIGEELYAAEAYIGSAPSAQARLLTFDALRSVVLLTIVVLIIARPLLELLGVDLSWLFAFQDRVHVLSA